MHFANPKVRTWYIGNVTLTSLLNWLLDLPLESKLGKHEKVIQAKEIIIEYLNTMLGRPRRLIIFLVLLSDSQNTVTTKKET